MTGSVIQLSMNFGYPGSYARTPDDIVMNKPVKSDSSNIPFGSAVVLNSNNTYSLAGSDLTAANFAGIAVREVKQGITYATYGVIDEQGEYRPYDPCDVLLRGNTVIKLARGTASAGANVLFRIQAVEEDTYGTASYEGPIGNGNVVKFNSNTYTIGDGTSSTTTIANLISAANSYQTSSASYNSETGILKISFKASTAGAGETIPALEIYASSGPAVGQVVVVEGQDAIAGAKVGDFEAGNAVEGYTVALPNVVFTTGESDANGIIEISLKNRNNN